MRYRSECWWRRAAQRVSPVVLKAGGLGGNWRIVFALGIATQRLDSKILTEAVKA